MGNNAADIRLLPEILFHASHKELLVLDQNGIPVAVQGGVACHNSQKSDLGLPNSTGQFCTHINRYFGTSKESDPPTEKGDDIRIGIRSSWRAFRNGTGEIEHADIL